MIKDYKIIKWNETYYVLKKSDHPMTFSRNYLYKDKIKKKCQEWIKNKNYPRKPEVSVKQLLNN